jgi:acyl-CoA dehydrogenase
MFALVRTSASERKQDGISFVLIDMNTPGITIRPIRTIGGDHEVNQVFFDEVRVPTTNCVGEEGKGWTYGKYLLEFERGGGLAAARLRSALEQITATAVLLESEFALKISALEIDIVALEMTELRVMSALQIGQNPGAISSVLKLRATELRQAVTRLGIEVLGYDALPWESTRPLYTINAGSLVPEAALAAMPKFLSGRAYTVFGGTSEIQRDILAKLMLGL